MSRQRFHTSLSTYLFALLIAIGPIASFANETAQGLSHDHISLASDELGGSWIENEDDGNDTDSLSCDSDRNAPPSSSYRLSLKPDIGLGKPSPSLHKIRAPPPQL